MTAAVMTDAESRKRLGQYFTGVGLARVLAALAASKEAEMVLDPMSGSGDMLAACCELGKSPKLLGGIEIDPSVVSQCRSRFERNQRQIDLVEGSAFDPVSWKNLPHAWDLVITNPPYVRYQSGSHESPGAFGVPSASEVRQGLIDCISSSTNLSKQEREVFHTCAKHYSGLADLAVPSWLLCCARVAVGGRLAVVVPNTWLSRDYAAAVLYLLRRFFVIECVVEDADVMWFPDALTRTTLVVARRVQDKGSPFSPGGHLQVSLPQQAGNAKSLVGAAFSDVNDSEQAFATWVSQRGNDKATGEQNGIRYVWSEEQDLLRALQYAAERLDWIPKDTVKQNSTVAVPEQLTRLVGHETSHLCSIQDLGWVVGQGLRTGANDFFYVGSAPEGNGYISPLLVGETLQLPSEVLRPALRRQSELPTDTGLVINETSSFALVLDGWALPEDIELAEGPRPWKPMTGDLARLVRTAATTCYRRGNSQRRLCELSAVRTNVRLGQDIPPRQARFWYHLPPLAHRHTPRLLMARVNGGNPTPYLNPASSTVIDANFSTLWPTQPDAVAPSVLWMLLSSSWASAFLESTGTVMGGGALKVEATHLRRLMLPVPDPATASQLDTTATRMSELASHATAVEFADEVVCELLGKRDLCGPLSALAQVLLQRRNKVPTH